MKWMAFGVFWLFAASMNCQADEPLESPDGRFRVVFDKTELGDQSLTILQEDETIYFSSTGYGTYAEATWSPDSNYLSVAGRGTKTTTLLEVFYLQPLINGKMVVVPVVLPDYRLNILGRYEKIEGGRYRFDESLGWEKGPAIQFVTSGSLEDGTSNPDDHPENWYRYKIMISFLRERAELIDVSDLKQD